MDDKDFDNVEEYPRWRAAMTTFLASGFKEDDIIEHDWLYKEFWIDRPIETTPKAIADKAQLAFLVQFQPFRMALLTEHQIDLDSVPGVGYRVTPSAKQTALAYEDGVAEIRKGFRKMMTRLVHVNPAALTAEQRRENADALAKATMMRSMVRKAKRLSFDPGMETE